MMLCTRPCSEVTFNYYCFLIAPFHYGLYESRSDRAKSRKIRFGGNIHHPAIRCKAIVHYSPYDIRPLRFSSNDGVVEGSSKLYKFIQVHYDSPLIVSLVSSAD